MSKIVVPIVFFYRSIIPSALITEALQHTLCDFPIFSGSLLSHNNQLYLDCNNQGVQVEIEHWDQKLANTDTVFDIQQLQPIKFVNILNPQKTIKQGTSVLTIKLNYFRDGMVIGYCWHHSVGDMATFMEFLKAFSASAKKKSYQRALMTEDREAYLKQWVDINSSVKPSQQQSKNQLKVLNFLDLCHLTKSYLSLNRCIYLYFSPEELEHLKALMSTKVQRKLTRNDVLCAHLLNCIAQCRNDKDLIHQASIVLNFRKRLGMSDAVQGNYIDIVRIRYSKAALGEDIASTINSTVNNYLSDSFCYNENQNFLKTKKRKILRIIPRDFLPQYKNLIITNWSNYDVYSIDFGIEAPFLFLPVSESPLPWAACIVEGFENKGALLLVKLPLSIAKRLEQSDMLDKIHFCKTF